MIRETRIISYPKNHGYKKKWSSSLQKNADEVLKRASRYLGAMMLHRLAGVKSTMRMEEYLAREVPLIEIAKRFVKGNYDSPSSAIKLVSLT